MSDVADKKPIAFKLLSDPGRLLPPGHTGEEAIKLGEEWLAEYRKECAAKAAKDAEKTTHEAPTSPGKASSAGSSLLDAARDVVTGRNAPR